jgi:anti-anti-sigma factor
MSTDDPYGAFARPSRDSVVTTRTVGNTLFATVHVADVTSTEAPVLGDVVNEAVTGTDGLRHAVIDLAAVRFLNSMALSTLVTAYTTADGRGVNLILSSVGPALAELLTVTKLTSVLTVCTTPAELEAALA